MPPRFPKDRAWPPLDVRPLPPDREMYQIHTTAEAPRLRVKLGDLITKGATT
jgi:hypothetical protein